MKRYLSLLTLLVAALIGCELTPEDNSDTGWNSGNVNNQANNLLPELFTLNGVVWSPGADDPALISENRFPISGALVAAYIEKPDPPSDSRFYCLERVVIPRNVPHATTDFDGSFTLKLMPDTDYYLVIQKGLFRRVRTYHSGFLGEIRDLEPSNLGGVKDPKVSLPRHHDPDNGDWTPRILVIVGRGEGLLGMAYEALGMVENVDFYSISDTKAQHIAENVEELMKYNIIVASCGDESTYLSSDRSREALREYVRLGGRLFIDDFAYDWVEQPFPEFLSFQVDYTEDYSLGICAEGQDAPDQVGKCVSYACYDPAGKAEDPYLQSWLDEINDASQIPLEYGCNIIRAMGKGVQGECEDPEDPRCVNGLLVDKPKVWMSGKWPGVAMGGTDYDLPITVSWDYYCGRVLYTTLHTHAGDERVASYKLLMQEKIMIYLLLELQTEVDDGPVE